MEKVIKIGKQSVKLNNNVAWTMEYKDQFGKDIVPALLPIIASMTEGVSAVIAESGGDSITIDSLSEAVQGRAMEIMLPLFQVEFVDTVINVTWAMAKAADENIDPPKQWVKQFDSFPLDDILPDVCKLIVKGFVSSKNLKRLKGIGANLKNLQPSTLTTLSSPDSNED